MPFVDILDGALNALSGGSLDRSMTYTLARAGVEAGYSGNEIQRGLSDYGLGLRRGTVQGIVRDVSAQRAAGLAGPPADFTSSLASTDYTERPGGRPGAYRHDVRINYRTRLGGGEYQLEETTFSVMSPDPLSPNDAISQATDIWNTHAEMYDDRELFGAQLGSLYVYTGNS